jgi:leucyl/phenylalanyl-tRNA--protein transferase
MPLLTFPDPEGASPEGIVAIGGDLHPETLRSAYRQGIFPWPVEDLPLLWFSPPDRGVLFFADLHVPRSLRRAANRSLLEFTIDRSFEAVIRWCAKRQRPGQPGTWITAPVIAAYSRLHRLGMAHSVEAWSGDDLVGGLYGVDVDGAFAAESMFYLQPNASKLALLYLVEHLAARGLDWLDIQVLTPHLARLGAKTIPRKAFLARLLETRGRGIQLFRSDDGKEGT